LSAPNLAIPSASVGLACEDVSLIGAPGAAGERHLGGEGTGPTDPLWGIFHATGACYQCGQCDRCLIGRSPLCVMSAPLAGRTVHSLVWDTEPEEALAQWSERGELDLGPLDGASEGGGNGPVHR